jgi:hypothetical protein
MAGTEIPTPICTTDRDHPVQSDSYKSNAAEICNWATAIGQEILVQKSPPQSVRRTEITRYKVIRPYKSNAAEIKQNGKRNFFRRNSLKLGGRHHEPGQEGGRAVVV